MKIAISQIHSLKGNIAHNIKRHIHHIELAIQEQSDLIIFPELSITNYEPTISEALAMTFDDPLLTPFQRYADQYDLYIGVGIPTRSVKGVHISLLVFRPFEVPYCYDKMLLHEDEIPYFAGGANSPVLSIKTENIGLGICYESLQKSHFEKTMKLGSTLYIASVSKPQKGVEAAMSVFTELSRTHQVPICMVNSIGPSDTFTAAGQSAIWDDGALLDQLEAGQEGVMCYDLLDKSIRKVYI